MMRVALAGVLLAAFLPLTASAQSADATDPVEAAQPPPAGATQGPMTVERIHNGFLFSPEARATVFDKKVFPLVGGSAGFVAQETFFIGGGGYWMPSRRSDDRRLAYGGVVLKWFMANSDRFGLSAGALLGGGEATLPQTVTQVVFPVDPRSGRNTPQVPPRTITTTVRVRDDFFAAEPELNARFALTKHVRLAAGAGYRFASNDWRRRSIDRGLDRRLSGATATFGVQIGG
jgi:hypothetical protein